LNGDQMTMKQKIATLTLLCMALSLISFAQKEKMTREDKDEKNAARTTRIKDKSDIAIFHRQMLSLPEYSAERMKIPNLQKANKMPVKVVAVVDTSGDMDDEASKKTLVGYIRQDIGDNSTNVYEVTFDRGTKKIVGVKHNAEAEELEKEEKTAPKKPGAAKATPKKSKDDDDDDDGDEDKTPKKKDKDDE